MTDGGFADGGWRMKNAEFTDGEWRMPKVCHALLIASTPQAKSR